jgi:hypothetical protein
MRLFKITQGVREGRYQAFGGRFGPGKIHKCVYDREQKEWYLTCRGPLGMMPYHGDRVDISTPVTCKKCLRG